MSKLVVIFLKKALIFICLSIYFLLLLSSQGFPQAITQDFFDALDQFYKQFENDAQEKEHTANRIAFFMIAPISLLAIYFILHFIYNLLTGAPYQAQAQRYKKFLSPSGKQQKLLKVAQKFIKKKDYQAAGDLCQMAQDLPQAIEYYRKEGNLHTVAELLERQGQDQRAAETWREIKQFAKAADCYERLGNHSLANEMYRFLAKDHEQNSRYYEAAEIYQKVGLIEKSASLYFISGHYLASGKLYEQISIYPKAAQAYEEYFKETQEKSKDWAKNLKLMKQMQELALRCAQLFEKSGLNSQAIHYYQIAEQPSKAAELLKTYDKPQEAFMLYVKSGDFEAASKLIHEVNKESLEPLVLAKIYAHQGQYLQAGEAYLKANQLEEAAGAFQEGKDFEKAASIYEKLGRIYDAASLLEKVGKSEKAAEILEKSNAYAEAAKYYEKATLKEKAAKCYQKAGDAIKAGEILIALGKDKDAIKALQNLKSDQPRYHKAQIMLGHIFEEQGLHNAARDRYQEGLANEPMTSENLPTFYKLACIYQNMKDFASARGLFERIIGVDISYRDVAKRLESLG